MGTDNDVGAPAFRSDEWYAARAAEAKAKLTGVRSHRYDRLVAATGVDVETLSSKAQMALVWLAGWDEPTVTGVIDLLDAAGRVGAMGVFADVARFVDDITVDDKAIGGDCQDKAAPAVLACCEAFWCRCGHPESAHQLDDTTGERGRCLAPFGRPRPVLVGGCDCAAFALASRDGAA